MNNTYRNKLKRFYRKLRYTISVFRVIVNGSGNKQCPCCGYEGSFEAVGSPPRYGALCQNCGSYERHRLLALSDKKHNFFQNKEVLHFSPEPVLKKIIKGKAAYYVTADIVEGLADRTLNIEDIDMADNKWDVILCSHVLEHVNDGKALAELYRVLKSDGVLIIMVPIIEGWKHTYENLNIHAKADREEHFGQSDHVRYYGRDIRDRILSHGFEIEEDTAYGEDAVVYGLLRGEKVFICRKKIKTGSYDN